MLTDQQGEAIEVRSADGEMEVRISLTESGPVLSLRGARLDIQSTDAISVSCRQFEVNTAEDVVMQCGGDFGIQSAGEVQLKSSKQTFIDGDYVNLNCGDRAGYHDEHGDMQALDEGADSETP